MAKTAIAKPKRRRKKKRHSSSVKSKASVTRKAASPAKAEVLPHATDPSVLEQMQRYIGNSAVVKYLRSLLADEPEKTEHKRTEAKSPSAAAAGKAQKTSGEPAKESGTGEQEIGVLSSKHESRGGPGVINGGEGDAGGASYGAYQFNSVDKVIDDFFVWLKDADNELYTILEAGYTADGNKFGSHFNAAFKQLGKDQPKQFLKAQHLFTKHMYYDIAVDQIKTKFGLDINSRSFAIKNVIWSRAVQHGVGGKAGDIKKSGIVNMMVKAFDGMDIATLNDEQIIRAIYKESSRLTTDKPNSKSKLIKGDNVKESKNSSVRALADEVDGKYMNYFSKNDSLIQGSVYYRLNKAEPEDALKMLYGKDYKFTGL